MSSNWVQDIESMQKHYKIIDAVRAMTPEQISKYLEFRINFLQEELTELRDAESAEDVVDALIDLVVVAIGTLDGFDVDSYKAWDEVLRANMNKEVGIKEGRPNPLGLPDLVKPEGWTPPTHAGNHGVLTKIFKSPCEV